PATAHLSTLSLHDALPILLARRNRPRQAASLLAGYFDSRTGATFMAASTTTSRPTPERIFNTMIAFQETEALKAAIELDIFTAIAEGADTAASLAAKTRAAERGVRILCDYFTVKELLTKKGE